MTRWHGQTDGGAAVRGRNLGTCLSGAARSGTNGSNLRACGRRCDLQAHGTDVLLCRGRWCPRGAHHRLGANPAGRSCVVVVACPSCGEAEDLIGVPVDGLIRITCGACGAGWDRDAQPRCGLCGGTDLAAIPTSTLEEHGRAGVRTPSGIRTAWFCWTCTGHDVTSTRPIPGPNPLPGRKRRTET